MKTIKSKGRSVGEKWNEERTISALLLAKANVYKGKFDLAEDICKECLRLDSSSVEAWEVLGLIYEKERSFVDAAESYERAWELSYFRSPSLGYKLAFNYLKGERYVEAIRGLLLFVFVFVFDHIMLLFLSFLSFLYVPWIVSEKILKEFPNVCLYLYLCLCLFLFI